MPGCLQVTLEPEGFQTQLRATRSSVRPFPLVFRRSRSSGSDTAMPAVIRQQVTCRRRQRRTRGVGLEDGKRGKLSAGLTTAQTLCTQTRRHTPTSSLHLCSHATHARPSSQSTQTCQQAGWGPEAQLTSQGRFQRMWSRISETTTTQS